MTTNTAVEKQLTFRFHAHTQAFVVSASLANAASSERNCAVTTERTLVLQTITFLHATSEETLH